MVQRSQSLLSAPVFMVGRLKAVKGSIRADLQDLLSTCHSQRQAAHSPQSSVNAHLSGLFLLTNSAPAAPLGTWT